MTGMSKMHLDLKDIGISTPAGLWAAPNIWSASECMLQVIRKALVWLTFDRFGDPEQPGPGLIRISGLQQQQQNAEAIHSAKIPATC